MSTPQTTPVLEKHFSIAEIAAAWRLSAATIRRLFEREPGVLAIRTGNGSKRAYTTLRIPESVAERVRRRMTLLPQGKLAR